MQLTANEVLGAYQLGLINQNEAREALGFEAISPIVKLEEAK